MLFTGLSVTNFTPSSLLPGLTWQDDVTQQVISSELSGLRSVPLHHQVPPSGPLGHSYSSSGDRKRRPELSRNLQQYLSSLGFLSQLDDGRRLELHGQDARTQVNISISLYLSARCFHHSLFKIKEIFFKNLANFAGVSIGRREAHKL